MAKYAYVRVSSLDQNVPAEGKKLQTSALYAAYTAQMRFCASHPMSVQVFLGEVKKRY